MSLTSADSEAATMSWSCWSVRKGCGGSAPWRSAPTGSRPFLANAIIGLAAYQSKGNRFVFFNAGVEFFPENVPPRQV